MEEKKINSANQKKNFSYSINFGAVEIVDESVHDLLGGPGCWIEED